MPVDATSTLMKNHVAGRVLPAQRQLAVASSDERSPFLFALDDGHRLTVTRPAASSGTGWAQVDLSAQLAGQAGLGAAPAVQCFAVSQQADGSIWLVVAASDSPGGTSRILLSRKFGNKLDSAEWTAFAQGLVPRATPDGAVFTNLVLGNADDDGGAPHIVGSAQQGGMVMHYQINPDPTDTSWTCEPVKLPQNVTECLAATAGNLPDLGRGVYALCRLETLVNLTFTTLPVMIDGEPFTQSRQLALPAGYTAATKTAIAALPTENGLTELYLSGNGLHRYAVAAQTQSNLPAEQIAEAALFTGTTRLAVSGDALAQGVDVWALNEADVLVYTRGTLKTTPAALGALADGNPQYAWQAPLALVTEVTGLAVYRVPDESAEAGNTAAAALGRSDGSLSLIGKDTVGDLWLPQVIALESHDAVVELNTYTTRITVTDADGALCPDTEVSLRADADVPALVNGRYYNLKSKIDKTAKTDAAGVLTIVLETADLSAPVYTVTVDGVGKQAAAGKDVVDKLRGVTTGTQIAQAKRTDGKALFPDGADGPKFEAAAAGIQRLVKVHDDLSDPARPRTRRFGADTAGDMGAAGPAVVRSAFGVRHIDGEATALHGDEALAALAELGDQRDVVGPGDLLWALWSGTQQIGDWFVNELEHGWEFVVSLAGQAMKFVFEFAAQAVAALDWVLQHTLGISLEDLIGWLGYLFNWDDILRNHKVLAHIVNLGFDHTVSSVLALTDSVHQGANKLRESLLHDKFVIDQSNAVLANRVRKAPPRQDAGTGTDSAEANWGNQQMAANGGSATIQPVTLDDLGDVLAGLAKDEAQIFVNAAEQFQQRIVARFDELTWAEVLDELLQIVGATVLTTLENVAITFLEAVAILIKVFKQLINARWDVPVLTYVYEQIICRGDGSKLTLLDLIALLGAIPATVLCKAVTPDHRDLFTEATATAVLNATTWDAMVKALIETASSQQALRGLAGAALEGGKPAPAIEATIPFQVLRAVYQSQVFVLSALAANQPKETKWILDVFGWAGEITSWAAYVMSLVNLALVAAATPDTTSARFVIDDLIISLQVLVRIKQTYVILWRKTKKSEPPALPVLCGIEAFMGYLMFIGAAASAALQAKETAPPNTTPVVFGLQISFKCLMRICASSVRVLAPVTVLPDKDPDKKLILGIRTILSAAQALSLDSMAVVGVYNTVSDIY